MRKAERWHAMCGFSTSAADAGDITEVDTTMSSGKIQFYLLLMLKLIGQTTIKTPGRKFIKCLEDTASQKFLIPHISLLHWSCVCTEHNIRHWGYVPGARWQEQIHKVSDEKVSPTLICGKATAAGDSVKITKSRAVSELAIENLWYNLSHSNQKTP